MVFVLCLDDVSDVVVVHSVIHFKTLKFPKWWKSLLWDTTNLNERNLWQQQEVKQLMHSAESDVVVVHVVQYISRPCSSLNGGKVFCKSPQT